jgi:transcriptional regulator with XRE-family HTH domain
VRTTDVGRTSESLVPGRVVLDAGVLKQLRHGRQLSQEELANECFSRHVRVSISSIKRAETGKPVLFRIARELARFYNVPTERLICASLQTGCDRHLSADNTVKLDDGSFADRYELNRLRGLVLSMLGLAERSIPYLLQTAEIAREDEQRCEAWCALTEAYLGAHRRGEAERAMQEAERYALLSHHPHEWSVRIGSLRRLFGTETSVTGSSDALDTFDVLDARIKALAATIVDEHPMDICTPRHRRNGAIDA